MRRVLWLWGVCLLAMAGCETRNPVLTIRVHSGLRAGDELRELQVSLFHGGACSGTSESLPMVMLARSDQDALSRGTLGAGEVERPVGTHAILVRADVASRNVRRCVVVSLIADRVVRIPLTVDCLDVECPAPAGSPSFSECLNGRCVDPRCDPDDPSTIDFCCDRTVLGDTCDADPTLCRAADDCTATLTCAAPDCVRGVCAEAASECDDGSFCSIETRTCEPREATTDAGTLDADPTELDAAAGDAGADDAGSGDAGSGDSSAAIDAFAPPPEDCVLLGDEDGANGADCSDPVCASHPVCTLSCAPIARPGAPVADVPTPLHWYRGDLGVVVDATDRVCAWVDLVGDAHFAAFGERPPAYDVGTSTLVVDGPDTLDVTSDLGVGAAGSFTVFLVTQARRSRGSVGDFVVGTPTSVLFQASQGMGPSSTRYQLGLGTALYDLGFDRPPEATRESFVVGSLVGAPSMAERVEYRLNGFAAAPRLLSGSDVGGDGTSSGVVTARFGGTSDAYLLLELITYDRALDATERGRVEAYLDGRY